MVFPFLLFDSLTGPRFLIGPQILYLANFGASRPRSITRLAHMPFGSEPAVVAPPATPAPSDPVAAQVIGPRPFPHTPVAGRLMATPLWGEQRLGLWWRPCRLCLSHQARLVEPYLM